MLDEFPTPHPDAPPPRYRTTLLERTLEMRVRTINRKRTSAFMLPPLAAYFALIPLLPRLQRVPGAGSSVISFPLICFFGLTAAAYVWSARRPFADFGVSRYGLRRSVTAGALWAIPLCLLAMAAKALWIRADPSRAGHALLEAGAVAARYSPTQYAGYTIGYLLFTGVQEFVARGVTQTALEEILPRWQRPLIALLLANALFALTHLHISPVFAVVTFVPGLLWGWLFARHRNLAGPTVNHALTGLFAYFVLDASLLR